MSNQLQAALDRYRQGEFLIVTDDANRENEGDLILLGSAATTEKIAFMIRYTSGVICLAMTDQIAKQLKLPMMVRRNQDYKKTAFTISVDAKAGLTTGISASERANTLRTLSSPLAKADDFVRPGHVFPLVAHSEGLAGRNGHTEAAVALSQSIGAYPTGIISELVNDDGSMMRGDSLFAFASEKNISIITIAELTEHVASLHLDVIEPKAKFIWADLPRIGAGSTKWKIATFIGVSGAEHAVMKLGEISATKPTLMRVHSECLTGDALGSARCDCGPQLNEAMRRIESEGQGVLVYMVDHEGRGIGLAEKIRAYQLQDQGLDTVDANLQLGHQADERTWEDAIAILKQLGITNIRLLTNNPSKVDVLTEEGFKVIMETLQIAPNPFSQRYLATKRDRMDHQLDNVALNGEGK